MTDEFKQAQFTMDFFGDGVAIDGYTYGGRWNGWAIPYFTFENAQKLIPIFEGYLSYDADQDAFIYFDPVHMDDEEKEIYESSMIDGNKYYSVGGMSFCWDQVKTKSEAN
jgi:hypothetical protein